MKKISSVFVGVILCLNTITVTSAQMQKDTAMLNVANGLEISDRIKKIATYSTGIFNQSSAEIVSYDSYSKKIFVTNASTNAVDVLQLKGKTLTKIASIGLSTFGGGVNSVSAYLGVIAVAVQAENKQKNGSIEFFNHNGVHLKTIVAGALPDMVTFSKDGKIAIAANEGEPNNDYTVDPKGSVTIIDIEKQTSTSIDFTGLDLPDSGMKFYNSKDKAADIEPEYIAINESGTKAYVTLQENNGVAIIDLVGKKIEKVIALGFKDFSLVGNEIDANNNAQISLININVFGLYQPDSIAVYTVNGEDYFVTANEGDDREYAAYKEETKVLNLTLDSSLDTSGLSKNVRVTPELGDIDGDGDYDQLYMMGARSFSIWNSKGKLIFDSGSQLQRHVINVVGEQYFNTRVDETDDIADITKMKSEGIHFSLIGNSAYFFEGKDARSEKKGIEPEALTLGTIGSKTYAFIGLEKQGGFFMYDITNPIIPKFIKYQNTIDYTKPPKDAGDLGPEGMVFIPADKSPNGHNLLVVANEISGTTTVYEISK
ncbi:MAG: choice-of-anchor I family protein [Pseudomonadota bacterium]